MTAEETGGQALDIVLVTGDAYVDHPAWGVSLIGRWLEANGFSVGIIAQPDWTDVEAFRVLGRPRLFFGITSGNMDSMVNRYTPQRHLRRKDESPERRQHHLAEQEERGARGRHVLARGLIERDSDAEAPDAGAEPAQGVP